MDYSYECVAAENIRSVEHFGARELVLVDLRFEDEHGHELVLQTDTLVVLEDGDARIVGYPEDVYQDEMDCPDASTWDKIQLLCDKYPAPTFSVDNEEEFDAFFV